ncbi:MAG: fibronectin type III domain-containing protein [Anaerolineae bacterium]|nr:fibronectin type III domain-containing protein [Anaerolineae bacterium]
MIAAVTPHFTVQSANSLRLYALQPIADELRARLAQVGDRIIVQAANSNRQLAFGYPTALVGDTVSPLLSDITASVMDSSVKITWATDEVATTTVLYGVRPGSYSQTVSDPLYVRQHSVNLTGLTSDGVYYYKVRSTDRSGNTSTSVEYRFTVERVPNFIFLPLVQRNQR